MDSTTARRGHIGCKGSSEISRRLGIDRDFPIDLSFVGSAVAAAEIGKVVQQDPTKPPEEFRLGGPSELCEIALGFQERFLDQIRGTGFREQVAVHLLVSHQLEIGAAGFECRAERLVRTRSGGGNPVGEFIVGVGHCPNLLGTGSVKIGHFFFDGNRPACRWPTLHANRRGRSSRSAPFSLCPGK